MSEHRDEIPDLSKMPTSELLSWVAGDLARLARQDQERREWWRAYYERERKMDSGRTE